MTDIIERLESLADCDARSGEPLGKAMIEAKAEIKRLRAKMAKADALAEWVEGIIEDGCPQCGGDCSSSNPPVAYCPQEEAMQDLAAYRETDT